MKGRFTALDLRAAISELQPQLVETRLQNLYDTTPIGKAFLLKFHKSETKISLLIESGTRLHSTVFTHERPNTLPSGFAAKLRKHLRGRRLCKLSQVGFDRVAHFEFGTDLDNEKLRKDHEYHLFIEFFASGNVILTDWEKRIIAVLRPVELENTKIAVGQIYDPESGALNLPEVSLIESFGNRQVTDLKVFMKENLAFFSPQMIDHCMIEAGIGKKSVDKITQEQFITFLNSAEQLRLEISAGKDFGGFLLVKSEDENIIPLEGISSDAVLADDKKEFVEFNPLKLKGKDTADNLSLVTLPSFNDAVDVFFTRLEALRATQRVKSQETEAQRKLETIKAEQQSRISGLDASIDTLMRKAQLIEENFEIVESALKVARTALESGMDWTEFSRLIATEQKNPNEKRASIAKRFKALKLENDQVTLTLGSENEPVDVVISMTPHANSTRYYNLRSQAKQKLERTIQANTAAIKSAEAKIQSDLRTSRQLGKHRQIHAVRKPFWFEKFIWFVSTDGFLVLAGRDAQQNEMLVKKYLRPGDIYVHADIHGAGSIIIKNHCYPKCPIPPPKTLHEAGCLSICASRAWDAKIVTSAWWVHAEQISKTAPSGEYLATGSFMIRGQKNFLPPSQLSLSFGFMFALPEEEKVAKREARLARESGEEQADEEQRTSNQELRKEEEKYRAMLDVDKLAERVSDHLIINTGETFVAESSQKAKSKQKKQEQKSVKKKVAEKRIEKADSKKVSDGKQVRGKHGKNKKIKEKYGDQDEEERQLRLKLLGSVAKKDEPSKPVREKKEETEEDRKKYEEKRLAKQQQKQATVVDEIDEDVDEEEGEKEESSGSNVDFIAADFFTSTPSDESPYLFAIPVCAPTSALNSARFRLKLIPGSLKKGKAAKSAVALLTSADACPVTGLRDLMRAVPENELLNVMPAKVALGVSAHETSKLKKGKKSKK